MLIQGTYAASGGECTQRDSISPEMKGPPPVCAVGDWSAVSSYDLRKGRSACAQNSAIILGGEPICELMLSGARADLSCALSYRTDAMLRAPNDSNGKSSVLIGRER